MRRTAKTTAVTGVATGAIVIGGASALAFLAPSAVTGSTTRLDGDSATTPRTATVSRDDVEEPESDDMATAARTEAPESQATFSDSDGAKKTVTFEPDEQGDRMSAQHSQGRGATDPDEHHKAAPSTQGPAPAGEREGGGHD